WIDAGVTLSQLFDAATIENAKFFGLDGEIGTIEVGKRADLLLLGKNPLHDLAAYDAIEYIILNGEAIERSSLSAHAE
ncbi:MAG: amidohydrolase family protein, partial [Gammaproteobacteria bacterium]|nr:amidohydrolase family protein [Gammaproteobacteria bacterium]